MIGSDECSFLLILVLAVDGVKNLELMDLKKIGLNGCEGLQGGMDCVLLPGSNGKKVKMKMDMDI